METKLYKDMTAQEQLRWLTDFSSFAEEKLARLEQIGDVWEQCSIKDMETGLTLVNAFAYAREFVKTSLCFQDYARRVSRLKYYVERIKKDISRDMVVQGVNGETYAYIPAMQGQSRRRGRPTREEALARVTATAQDDAQQQSGQAEKERKIAALLGLEIVTDTPRREKNNAELAAERAAQEAEKSRQQASLFDDISTIADKVDAAAVQTEQAQTIVGSGDVSVSSALPRLNEIKWLLTPELAAEVDNVRNYRATAAAAAERAKTMAELGVKADDVAVYAKEAAVNTDCYEKVFERVDGELAALYVRLREDEPFTEQFKSKWHINDTAELLHLLRPYFSKQDAGFADRVRKVIAEESPEAVAKREQERQTKARVDAIVKYLMRKDKKASAQRVKTMERRIAELEELRGKEFADVYRPLLDKAREEVESKKQTDVENNK